MDETSHQGSRRGGAGLTFQLEQVCCGNVIQRSSLKQGKHKPRELGKSLRLLYMACSNSGFSQPQINTVL